MSATRLMMLGCPDVLAARIDAQITAQASDADELVASGLHPVTASEVARCINSLTNDPRPLIALGVQPHLANEIVKLTAEGAGLVFDNDFTQGYLDPRITFSRPGDSYRTVNGVLRKWGPNEPVLTGAGLDTRPAETNLAGADIAGSNWANSSNRLTMGPVVQLAGFDLRKATVAVSAPQGAYVQWVPQITITPGRVTMSTYIRHDSPGWAYVMLRDDSKNASAYAFANLATGVVGNAAGNPAQGITLVDATLEPLSDGVWRFDLVIQTDGTQIRPYLYGQVAGNGDISSEGLVGNVWYAAVQVNQGDPIPYIPTTDSAVTRPADKASIQGDAFAEVFNPMEGAIVVDVETALLTPASQWPVVFTVSDGTTANRLWFYRNPSGETLKIIGISAGHPGIAESSIPAPLNVRVGLRWNSAGDIAVDTNGVKQAEFPAAMNMSAMSWFNFGGAGAFGQASVPAIYRRLRIFTRRPSDARMEAMTS